MGNVAAVRIGVPWGLAVGLATAGLAARGVDRWSWTVALAGGVVGLALPLAVSRSVDACTWTLVTLGGLCAFVAARAFWALPVPGDRWAIGVAAAAGVAEELLFRRAIYGWLERLGPAVAVASSGALFALVHVPVYGWRVVPVDLAAGVLFGWQRWATGSWTSPAVTHAAANVIQYL